MVILKINFKNCEICCGSLIKKGTLVGTGDSRGNIRIINHKRRFESIETFKIHDLEITDIKTVKSTLISSSHDTALKVWDMESQKLVKTYLGHSGPINSLDVFDNYISTASEDGDIRLWDRRIRYSTGKIRHGFNLLGGRFLNTQNLLISYGLSRSLFIWDLRMSRTFLNNSMVLKKPNSFILSLCVSKLSNFIFFLDSDQKVCKINSQLKNIYSCSYQSSEKVRGHFIKKDLIKLNLDEKGKFLLNGDSNGKAYIRYQKTGKIANKFYDHCKTVKEILLDNRRKIFFSCGTEGLVVIRTSSDL